MRIKCKADAYELGAEIADAYRTIYPTADLEFARMLLWLERNPSRRPASPKSAPRFVSNWFKRVPRVAQHNPAREQRAATVAALTGRNRSADVIDIQPFADSMGRADLRAIHGDLWAPEDRRDVDGRGPGARQICLG